MVLRLTRRTALTGYSPRLLTTTGPGTLRTLPAVRSSTTADPAKHVRELRLLEQRVGQVVHAQIHETQEPLIALVLACFLGRSLEPTQCAGRVPDRQRRHRPST